MTAQASSLQRRGALLGLGLLLALYLLHLLHLLGWSAAGPAYVTLFLGGALLTSWLARFTVTPGAWRWMALGVALWGAGQGVYTLVAPLTGQVSLADAFFLALPVCFLMGFREFERHWPTLTSRAAQLDVAALVMALGAFAWFGLMAQQVVQTETGLFSRVVVTLYPLSDLLLLTLLLAQAWRGPVGSPRGLQVLAGAMLCMVAADLGYLYLTAHGAYSGADWPDALWPVTALLLPVAALRATRHDRQAPRDLPRWVRAVSPYAALLGTFLLVGTLASGVREVGVVAAAFVVALLVAARQTLALLDLERQGVDLQRSQALLMFQAEHDALTGLGNRAKLQRLLAEALAPRGPGRPVGLVMMDLDDFRYVNDALGHRAGDEFLKESARRVQQVAGAHSAGAVACRLGADEFVVLVPEAAPDGLLRLGEALRAALSEPVLLDGQRMRLTASLGAALGSPGLLGADLLRWADLALADARRGGRDAVHLFDPQQDDAAAARRVLVETRLRGALERGELRLHYQPQQERSGAVRHFEALLRWQDALLGQVSPAEFVPVAETAGLITELDLWVLNEACQQLRAWRTVHPTWQVAVNISPPLLLRRDFVPRLRDLLAETGVAVGSLELEVTERLLIEHEDQTRETLRALLDLGIGVALDDFGVGQSSLSSLLHLPITTLKIDRAFVRPLDAEDAVEAQAAFKIVQAIVALARSLHLRVVAEGVETGEQAAAVWRLGLDAVQGYWTGRPVPPEALVRPAGLPAPLDDPPADTRDLN
ncbi:putative bifunctional diguanylate cyclase/phosphodiesterase [Deinococcus sedimenti]|uniref:EAL domain-containing protein n=1 Tax=Deinococcus sedimenti TaxID=1867090 RepID=A0ABQ2S7B7_9DEIO|nr:bifunctional diguanylate cyclase/phosphodiesterase [Deinococcus sedimenti]GGS04536.1 hypothetical protein GCM10008960_33970 [Deinococcus sedimenti]